MQQYRLNYPLLIGLMVGSVFVSGAVYLIHKYQINRNANALITEAADFESQGKHHDAADSYGNYLSIRPDDDAARVKFANAWADVTQEDSVSPEDFSRGVQVLEETVRTLPDEKALQRRLVDLYIRVQRYQDAVDHLNYMLAKSPDDAELQAMRAENLARAGTGREALTAALKLVGYDEKTDAFDVQKASAPHVASGYLTAANLARSQSHQPELADRIMDQAVKVNPDSAEAYLARGQYCVTVDQGEKGARDIEKAYKLKPDDPNVLLAMAERAESEKKNDRAVEFLKTGKTKYPDDPRFYQALGSLAMQKEDFKAALEIVNEGLKAVPGQKGQGLLFFKADLQFLANDIPGVRDTMEAMRKARFRPELVDFEDARIMLVQGKWNDASKSLQRLRAKLGDMGGLTGQMDVQLGVCYERLGQIDQAAEAYELVLQQDPTNQRAVAGKQRIAAQRGKSASPEQQDLENRIQAMLAKPKAEQDWTDIDKQMDKLADRMKLEGVSRDLFWENLMLMREDYAAAKKYLLNASNKDSKDIRVKLAAIELLQRDPSAGPDKAMQLLDKVVTQFGDHAAERLLRANLLIAQAKKESKAQSTDATTGSDTSDAKIAKDLKEQLSKLATAADDWSDDEKIELWNGLASRLMGLGMRDEATAYLAKVTDLRPDELPTLMTQFGLALEAGDDAGMRAAQDKILHLKGSKNDSTWLYTEARRQLTLIRRGDLSKDSLAEARLMTEKALQQRPDWFELHLVKAELELMDGKDDKALDEFEKAEQLGKVTPTGLLQHAQLLLNRGQFDAAKKLVEQLPVAVREGDLGRQYAEILLNTGAAEEAARVADKYRDADPSDAGRQLWCGQLLARCAETSTLSDSKKDALMVDAGKAFQRSVELGPDSPEAWLAVNTFYAVRKDPENAQSSLKQAQLALSDDLLVAVLARGYEVLGRWFDAESMYLSAYHANPDNYRMIQQLATFYLGPGYPLSDKAVKATPLVNQLLHAGADGKLPANDSSLVWARRTAAQMLADSKEYQQLLKAENLLTSNLQNGALTLDDRLKLAQILASRPEPISRLKAINILEKVASSQKLSLENELELGKLYFAVGDWAKCQKQMRETVGRYPTSADVRAEYIGMLLDHGDKRSFDEAARQLAKLKENAPGDGRTLQLTVRLAGKTGKQQEARSDLLHMLPVVNDPKDVTDKQVPLLSFVAGLLVELKDLDNAEKIYKILAARDPSKNLDLAGFLGQYRDLGQAFDLLGKSYTPDKAADVTRVGIAVARARRDETGDKYDSQIQGWLDRALLENPDSVPLLMLQAEFYDVEKRYDDAAAVYRKLLKRQDLTGVSRAIVLNNLAYLVTLAGASSQSDTDPLKLIEEASQILGPTTDILDTRSAVNIANKEYQKAIRDSEYAVTDNPSPSKYFHLAAAHLYAGENKAAIEAWDKGNELGDIKKDLNRLEYDRFDDVKAKIDQLKSQNSKVTEADRPRQAG
jgi:tetratricopeptide (TPR) repeat protein